MSSRLTDTGYRALAEFRYQIRHFLSASEKSARSAGLEPEQYLLLLAVRGMPVGNEPSIQALAFRLGVHHNTAVERVDRLAHMGLVRRNRSRTDARVVQVGLTGRGDRILEKLARKRMTELSQSGPELITALTKVVLATQSMTRKKSGQHRNSGSQLNRP
ncbi:MAG TPA: MarR family transcriptional regulator [Candidatus Limnocylindrales bacterium]|nr:MarR family transcriptional regulator [Candidatus Limnocylindrales bacterium]